MNRGWKIILLSKKKELSLQNREKKKIMKHYLVTGGAGFIGSNFVKYLLEKYGEDVKITILDSLTYAGNLLTIKEDIERPNVTFVKGDIRDAELVNKLLCESDADYIVNFAAESHVDRSITGPRVFVETNVLGTQTLLDAARRAWANGDGFKAGKKYLQISTDEVYGALEIDYPESAPLVPTGAASIVTKNREKIVKYGDGFFTEDCPLSPRSPYSASKASADMLVLAYHETYGLPVNITRCSNNYGPCHFPEKLIPLLINNILNGKKLPVYGKGINVRDWLYVTDHARAIDLVLRNAPVGEVYNVGGFNEMRNIDIVKLVVEITSQFVASDEDYRRLSKLSPEEINMSLVTYVTDRKGHDLRYAIDPSKIASELGWVPETPFAEGIVKTVKWYLEHHEWTESVTSGAYQKYYEEMYNS